MAAEMVAGAGLLLDERELFWGIQTAAETAFHIIPVFVLRLIERSCARRALDARTMPFPPAAAERSMARSSVRTISVVNRRVSSGTHRSPKCRERLFCMGIAVKVQVFPKGLADRVRKFLADQRAGAGKRRRQAFFPRRQHRRLLSQNGFPPRGLDGVHKLVFRHPFLPGKPVFRGEKKGRGMRAPQSIQCGTRRQLFFSQTAFSEREPRQIVVHGPDGRRLPTRRNSFSAYRPRTTCARGR